MFPGKEQRPQRKKSIKVDVTVERSNANSSSPGPKIAPLLWLTNEQKTQRRCVRLYLEAIDTKFIEVAVQMAQHRVVLNQVLHGDVQPWQVDVKKLEAEQMILRKAADHNAAMLNDLESAIWAQDHTGEQVAYLKKFIEEFHTPQEQPRHDGSGSVDAGDLYGLQRSSMAVIQDCTERIHGQKIAIRVVDIALQRLIAQGIVHENHWAHVASKYYLENMKKQLSDMKQRREGLSKERKALKKQHKELFASDIGKRFQKYFLERAPPGAIEPPRPAGIAPIDELNRSLSQRSTVASSPKGKKKKRRYSPILSAIRLGDQAWPGVSEEASASTSSDKKAPFSPMGLPSTPSPHGAEKPKNKKKDDGGYGEIV